MIAMRKSLITILFILVLSIGYGCTYNTLKTGSDAGKTIKLVSTKATNSVMRYRQYLPINPDDVEDYAIASNSYKEIIRHLPCIKSEAELQEYKKKLKQDIAKQVKILAAIVNSYSEVRKSTQDEISSIGYKRRIPLTFVIKDKSYIHIMPIMKKAISRDTSLGKLVQREPYTDRFIADIEKNDTHEYYTLYSKIAILEILKYGDDLPGNDFFSMDPNNRLLKDGDKLTLSGLGNINGDIKMFIESAETSDSHLVFNIGAFEGEWKIEFNIKRSFKAMDGTEIQLGEHKYSYRILWGPNCEMGGNLIDCS